VLEILWFPEGKGLEKWHRAGTDLFMGIDHTAIVVTNTESSLQFYRDLLGMRVAGESENYGSEQEHLNNVFGARLHITSLRAAAGPGVEFLEYLAPRDGRPIPRDLHSNDLTHWETEVITSEDPGGWLDRLKKADHISSAIAEIETSGERSNAYIIRDPDGHAVTVVGPIQQLQ